MTVHTKDCASDADRSECSHAERASLCVYSDDQNLIKNILVFFSHGSILQYPLDKCWNNNKTKWSFRLGQRPSLRFLLFVVNQAANKSSGHGLILKRVMCPFPSLCLPFLYYEEEMNFEPLSNASLAFDNWHLLKLILLLKLLFVSH